MNTQTEIDFAVRGTKSSDSRLGPVVMREIGRALVWCAETMTAFTSEHVFRECAPAVQDILSLAGNRNAMGGVFMRRAQIGYIVRTGRQIPACHAGSRGRRLTEWRRSDGG